MHWLIHGNCYVLACALAAPPMLFAERAFAEKGRANTDVGFVVSEAHAVLEDNVYYLHADVDYRFSSAVLQAIQNGVPLIVVLDVELYQKRRLVWDTLVASLVQRYELQFHALSEQYLVSNLNSGEEYTSLTLHSALYGMRAVNKLPLIDRQLLRNDANYYVRIRASLALNDLPVPLRLKAFVSRAWWLGSDWFRWPLLVLPQPTLQGSAR